MYLHFQLDTIKTADMTQGWFDEPVTRGYTRRPFKLISVEVPQ